MHSSPQFTRFGEIYLSAGNYFLGKFYGTGGGGGAIFLVVNYPRGAVVQGTIMRGPIIQEAIIRVAIFRG